MGIELPVEYAIGGRNFQVIAENRRTAMRRGTQLNDLRAERDRLLVPVLRPVMQSDLFRHSVPSMGWIRMVLFRAGCGGVLSLTYRTASGIAGPFSARAAQPS